MKGFIVTPVFLVLYHKRKSDGVISIIMKQGFPFSKVCLFTLCNFGLEFSTSHHNIRRFGVSSSNDSFGSITSYGKQLRISSSSVVIDSTFH